MNGELGGLSEMATVQRVKSVSDYVPECHAHVSVYIKSPPWRLRLGCEIRNPLNTADASEMSSLGLANCLLR